jgi:hypothetical protein
MKTIGNVVVICLFSVSIVLGQTVSLVATAPVGSSGSSQTLTIQTNQVASVLHVYVPPNADLVGQPVRIPWVDVTINSNTFEYKGAVNPVVAGPATIQVRVDNTNTYYQTPISVYATVQVMDNEPQFSPSTAVVIPSDATGSVQIVLESSPDLVNWTAALPGTYGSSATNRFFRVRAVHQ